MYFIRTSSTDDISCFTPISPPHRESEAARRSLPQPPEQPEEAVEGVQVLLINWSSWLSCLLVRFRNSRLKSTKVFLFAVTRLLRTILHERFSTDLPKVQFRSPISMIPGSLLLPVRHRHEIPQLLISIISARISSFAESAYVLGLKRGFFLRSLPVATMAHPPGSVH